MQSYTIVNPNCETELVAADLKSRIPALNKEVQFEAAMSCIKIALVNVDLELQASLKYLKCVVTMRPFQLRGVFAAADIKKNTLLMAPVSMNVQKHVDGKTYGDACEIGSVKWGSSSWRFLVANPKAVYSDEPGSSRLSLFWCTVHPEIANVGMTTTTQVVNGITIKVPVMSAKKDIPKEPSCED